ncbi:hypothetical protein AKJ16_DCAP03109 [Drosera capensis]
MNEEPIQGGEKKFKENYLGRKGRRTNMLLEYTSARFRQLKLILVGRDRQTGSSLKSASRDVVTVQDIPLPYLLFALSYKKEPVTKQS